MSDTPKPADADPNDDLDLDAPVDIADDPREPTEYERKLRREKEKLRRERNEERTARQAEAERHAAELARVQAEAVTAANMRVIKAELRAEATKAGMVDLDGLLLLDIEKAGVKLDENGNVTGATEALAAMKAAKPWLFGTPATGNTNAPPKPGEQKAKRATEMSAEEWRAARKKLAG